MKKETGSLGHVPIIEPGVYMAGSVVQAPIQDVTPKPWPKEISIVVYEAGSREGPTKLPNGVPGGGEDARTP
jgi:hypothetical protein